ncbi:MAG: TolC family protein [Pseudomonadota bacterium]
MRFKSLFIVSFVLGWGVTHAQQAARFDEIVSSALTTHPLVMEKQAGQVASRADRDAAEWQRYPSPSIEASTATQGKSASLFRLEQPLWSGGRITANIDTTISRTRVAGAALDETRQDLIFRVIAAASEAQRQQMRREHAEINVREHNRLLAMIERRVTQEVSPLADQNLARSRLYTAANELSVSGQALDAALVQLSQLAGQPVRAFTPMPTDDVGAVPPALETAQSLAIDHSPTLRRLAFEEEAAKSEIEVKKAAYFPQIVLRLERGPNANQVTENRAAVVLIAQPGAGLSARSGTEAAVARSEAARIAREGAERTLRERVAIDWNEWVAARTRLDNASQARSMASDVSDSYARQFTAGRKSWIDVLNAVREATQAELSLDDARVQVLAAALRLRAYSGTLSPLPRAVP